MMNSTDQVKEFCMAKKWKSEEHVWKREGFLKKSEEFLWERYEFVSWKVKEFIWPNDILCDVNRILSKCVQAQFWGCPGKPKFQFHILCGRCRLYEYTLNIPGIFWLDLLGGFQQYLGDSLMTFLRCDKIWQIRSSESDLLMIRKNLAHQGPPVSCRATAMRQGENLFTWGHGLRSWRIWVEINVGYRLVWGYTIVSTDSKIIL